MSERRIAEMLREIHLDAIWNAPWPVGLRERFQAIEQDLLVGAQGEGAEPREALDLGVEALRGEILFLREERDKARADGAALRTALRELAEAAQSYLIAEQHVGVTEDQLRALHHRLGSLAGPHLVAQTARALGSEGGTP